MKNIPFCRECVFYGGRHNGVGVCTYGATISAEHIKADFWCINGVRKWCKSCQYESEDKSVGRCLYCRRVHDDTGVLTEWELKNYAKPART